MRTKNAKLFHWAVYAAKTFSEGGYPGYSGKVALRSRWADKPIMVRATVEKLGADCAILDMLGWIGIDENRYVLKAVDVAEMRKAFSKLKKNKRKVFFTV